jgi:putative transposase
MVLIPAREHATNNAQTYFVTSDTWERRALFHAEPWARLFFQNLLSHRDSYLLHEFVLMPDHFHLLLSPSIALERVVQLIKGGFSFRAKKDLGSNAEVWQRGFSDHRIRDVEDYNKHRSYIHLNLVKKHLCEQPSEYKYSSAYPGWKLDPIPQGLKPTNLDETICGTAKAVPFQNCDANDVQGLDDEGQFPREVGQTSSGLIVSPSQSATAGALQGNGLRADRNDALKGHDFSRADEDPTSFSGALAPEGGRQ